MAKRSRGGYTESEAGEISALVGSVYHHTWGNYTVSSVVYTLLQITPKLKSLRPLPHDFCEPGTQLLTSDHLALDEQKSTNLSFY